MPLGSYRYHGRALGFDGEIIEPGHHVMPKHGYCEWAGKTDSGSVSDQHPGHQISGLLSHGLCSTSVTALPEKDGFFRTEITSTVENLDVEDGVFKVGKIHLCMVTMYHRDWWDRQDTRTRVVPYGCTLENVMVRGVPAEYTLPKPFHYSTDFCENYLRGAKPDRAVDEEIRQAITNSNLNFIRVKNFGRIFFGEWNLIPSPTFHPIHRISMLRMDLGSPQTGGGTGGTGEGDGEGGG